MAGFFVPKTQPIQLQEIQPNAVAADIVEFQLDAANGMWRKVLVMPDGLGSQWDIAVDPSRGVSSASNSLWADQVNNGQSLQFWKAKTFRIMHWVLNIGNLGGIQPGTRVVFRWLAD